MLAPYRNEGLRFREGRVQNGFERMVEDVCNLPFGRLKTVEDGRVAEERDDGGDKHPRRRIEGLKEADVVYVRRGQWQGYFLVRLSMLSATKVMSPGKML